MSLHNQPTNPWKNKKKKKQKMKIGCHSRFVPRTAREPCLTSKKISQVILLCRVHCLILEHANYCVILVEAECFFSISGIKHLCYYQITKMCSKA